MRSADFWDREASSFDIEPDHGLRDPTTRAAWRDLLVGMLPAAPAQIADLGCGTGTLTRLLVDEGYQVDGLDLSPRMLEHARAKVPESTFVLGDAADPRLPAGRYDVVLCRHVLWAFDDPAEVVRRWVDLLAADGRLVLVEGRWHTGGGIEAVRVEEILRASRSHVEIRHLPEAVYWGAQISDERFVAVSRR